jgi:hypothetical protein
MIPRIMLLQKPLLYDFPWLAAWPFSLKSIQAPANLPLLLFAQMLILAESMAQDR